MNIYNTNKRTSRLISKGFVLVLYPSITHLWLECGRIKATAFIIYFGSHSVHLEKLKKVRNVYFL